MNDLFKKYLNNQLTNEELSDFQKLVNASTNEEIEALMSDSWETEKTNNINKNIIGDIKRNIDNQNKQSIKQNNKIFIRKIMRVAAIVVIPVMLITSYVYFSSAHNYVANDMVVSVAEGEKANITLPDGTKARLNAQTTLSYDVTDFNKRERRISLSGEAYFEVAKNKNKPFIIETSYLNVRVLGTTFDLLARDENNLVEIALKEGKVNLTSNLNQDEVILYPNQKAILDKKTGEIAVIKFDPEISTAWMRGELVFHGASVHNIFREIERSYGVKIVAKCPDSVMNDLFTGTFSVDNLDETMNILKMHYKFNYTIEGKTVKVNGEGIRR